MPTNVTPEFKKVQAEYRRASDPHERLALLREMMRVVPKHKGTEHLRGDIKSKIKELSEEISSPSKGGTRTGPQVSFRSEGAGQIALVGPPNSGKSALHARLTGSHSVSEPYPFATQFPQPGMFPYENVAFQLIDVPSVAAEHPIPFIADSLHHADGCLFVVDLSMPGCVELAETALRLLHERRVRLTAEWPFGTAGESDDDDDDIFSIRLPTLVIANKTDLISEPDAELEVFEELLEIDLPAMAVSAETGAGLDQLGPWLFDRLGVIRVYTKIPGQGPDMGNPFTLRRGDNVLDLAELIHKDVAAGFRFARVWGAESFDGQQVGREHELADADVVEIHA
jgi:ribosome-interacting GTPase 1